MDQIDTGTIRASAHDLVSIGGDLAGVRLVLDQASSTVAGALVPALDAVAESLARFASAWGQEAQLEANSCVDLASLLLEYARAIEEADAQGAEDLTPR